MKKLFYLLFVSTCYFSSVAQITLTTADMPSAGALWVGFEDNRPGIHSTGTAGANQTWNFTVNYVVDDTSAMFFQLPSVTPAPVQAAFPNSTITIIDYADTAYTMLSTTAAGLYIDGLYDGTIGAMPAAISFNPKQLVFPTPFTMGNTRNSTSKWNFILNQGGTDFKFEISTIGTFTADAWGSLSTLAGTYPSTLRIKYVSYSVDSTFMDVGGTWMFLSTNGPSDTSTTYSWFKNGAGTFLFESEEDDANPGMASRVSYYSNQSTGLAQQLPVNNKMVAFPIPAKDFVTFRFADNRGVRLQLVDVTGKLVQQENVYGIDKLTLQVSGLERGMYVVRVLDAAGVVIETSRVVLSGK